MVIKRRPGRPTFADALAKPKASEQERKRKEDAGTTLLLDFENRTYGSRKEAREMARAFPGVPFYAQYTRSFGGMKREQHIKYESDGVFLTGEYI